MNDPNVFKMGQFTCFPLKLKLYDVSQLFFQKERFNRPPGQ